MSNTSEGLIKKEGFKPEASSPPQTKVGMRPKHDNEKIKRKVAKPRG